MSRLFSFFLFFAVVMIFLSFSGCAGSQGDTGPVVEVAPQVDLLKEKTDEATVLEKENHELRKEIFEMKGKLGLPQDEGETGAE